MVSVDSGTLLSIKAVHIGEFVCGWVVSRGGDPGAKGKKRKDARQREFTNVCSRVESKCCMRYWEGLFTQRP